MDCYTVMMMRRKKKLKYIHYPQYKLTTLQLATPFILTSAQDFLFREGQGGLASREFLTQLSLVALLVGFRHRLFNMLLLFRFVGVTIINKWRFGTVRAALRYSMWKFLVEILHSQIKIRWIGFQVIWTSDWHYKLYNLAPCVLHTKKR